MRDLAVELRKGKEKGIYSSQEEFRQYLQALQTQIPTSKIDWDDDAGEDWACLSTEKFNIILHAKIHIAFLCMFDVQENIPSMLFSDLHVVSVQNTSVEEWFFDSIEKLKDEFPEFLWHTSDDSVDHRHFSASDLYWATV